MTGRLHGAVSVITGAASGIGAGIARSFADEGCHVVVVDVVPEHEVRQLLAELTARGVDSSFVRADVADEAHVQRMGREVLERFGRVDILVNNAGIFSESSLENMTVEEWDRVLNVNLRGTYLCTSVFLAQMLQRGSGRIINIASQLGQIGGVHAVHYSASKAGVIGFTKALAREVAARGVLVNAVAPGPIETPLLASESEEWRSAKLAELPLGRFGTVEEVTPAVVLLASQDGSYFVGQTLGPNGGDVML